MNLASFVDELIKLGTTDVMAKLAGEIEATSTDASSSAPEAMMGTGATPPALRIIPKRAASRLSETYDGPSLIEPGTLGSVTSSTAPLDRDET